MDECEALPAGDVFAATASMGTPGALATVPETAEDVTSPEAQSAPPRPPDPVQSLGSCSAAAGDWGSGVAAVVLDPTHEAQGVPAEAALPAAPPAAASPSPLFQEPAAPSPAAAAAPAAAVPAGSCWTAGPYTLPHFSAQAGEISVSSLKQLQPPNSSQLIPQRVFQFKYPESEDKCKAL